MILSKFRGLCCVVEPHELPTWFKVQFDRSMTVVSDSDDDFVILAQSQSLVTSVNIRKANGFMTDVRKDPPCEIVVDDDVDEISNVLKKRFSSPETV